MTQSVVGPSVGTLVGHCRILEHLGVGGMGEVYLAPDPRLDRAVLPFEDMSPDRDHEYFCDGITEELINALACVGGLRVIARTSPFAFKGRPEDAREIGRKLGVEKLLEGSVR